MKTMGIAHRNQLHLNEPSLKFCPSLKKAGSATAILLKLKVTN